MFKTTVACAVAFTVAVGRPDLERIGTKQNEIPVRNAMAMSAALLDLEAFHARMGAGGDSAARNTILERYGTIRTEIANDGIHVILEPRDPNTIGAGVVYVIETETFRVRNRMFQR